MHVDPVALFPLRSPRRRLLLARGTLAAAALSGGGTAHTVGTAGAHARTRRAPARIERRGVAFGTLVRITVVHDDVARARRAAQAALREIALVDALLSVQFADSAVARLNAAGVLERTDPRLLDVLRASQYWSAASAGAFDVTVQPLWQAFEQARAASRLPDDAAIDALLPRIGWRRVLVGDERVTLGAPGVALTLNGINQGYAADRALAVLRAHGIGDALVDSGEFQAAGHNERGAPWRVGVRDPRRHEALLGALELSDRAIATSGDYEYTFSADRLHHHIFDPRSGHSPRELASVTVIAANATDADALSTAVMVLGAREGARLVAATPGASAVLVDKLGRVDTVGADAAALIRS